MPYRYFAYGSALDAEHVAQWCREHGYSLSLGAGQPAVLVDHELSLTVPSRYWMGAVGTLSPKPGSSVHGVLFELPDEQAGTIRHKEGVTTGLYREVSVEVDIVEVHIDEERIAAAAFCAAHSATRDSAAPPPSQQWLDVTARGARAHGLPESWVAWLLAGGRR